MAATPAEWLRDLTTLGFSMTGSGGGVVARGGDSGRRKSSESKVSLRRCTSCSCRESEYEVSLSVKLETDPPLYRKVEISLMQSIFTEILANQLSDLPHKCHFHSPLENLKNSVAE